MDSKKTTSIYAITNNKIDSLRAFINLSKEMYHSQKNDLNNNDFLEWLKLSCFQIDEKIVDTIEYYQYNVASIKTIEKAKDKCKDLSILLNKYKLELFNDGFSESDYLAYKKVLKDAFDFDFDLSKETKEPLVNYLEVKKEFEDFVKIETSTQTLKQNKNLSLSINSIFTETTSKDKFINYLKLHIIEPYVDYSYLFQRMLDENIIVKTKHLDFVNWLYENKHITENIKDLIIKNNGFRSLSKSYSTQRENNFNNVFNL